MCTYSDTITKDLLYVHLDTFTKGLLYVHTVMQSLRVYCMYKQCVGKPVYLGNIVHIWLAIGACTLTLLLRDWIKLYYLFIQIFFCSSVLFFSYSNSST